MTWGAAYFAGKLRLQMTSLERVRQPCRLGKREMRGPVWPLCCSSSGLALKGLLSTA